MKTGQELYKKAKNIIPGGTMLLSKRPEMFLPEGWPSYYQKSKGIQITDLDGNVYKDMTIMGIGTNTLGYGNENVDNAVLNSIKNGNMSTLSCPEEVILAEKLIEINSWASMVRFARSGGEANAIAIRIARAATGKSKVAICGYHGWHDWYLSANHNDSNDELEKHLLPGLSVSGVPSELKSTTFGFEYNNFNQLVELVSKEDIGVIKMEVMRNFQPEDDFLLKVRQLADKKNIVLIFDECTSGFRETYGGLHKKYSVEPDIAMYGKTLGNGYAITAVIGRKEIMDATQKTFISSTFWTERIGPSAAIATLEEMYKLKSWEYISKLGYKMKLGWEKVAKNNNLNIEIFGLDALATYSFVSSKSLEYKTLITQEMLKKNILASTNFYPSTCHTEKDIDEYLDVLNDIFLKINKIENDELDLSDELKFPVCHSGFKRLN